MYTAPDVLKYLAVSIIVAHFGGATTKKSFITLSTDCARRRLVALPHQPLLRRPRLLHHRGFEQPGQGQDQARRNQVSILINVLNLMKE